MEKGKSRKVFLSFLGKTDYKECFYTFEKEKSKKTSKNGLDEAISEVEQGEVEIFKSFDDFKAAMV